MIFRATRRVAASSTIFRLNVSHTLWSAADILSMVSGSNACPDRNGRIDITHPLLLLNTWRLEKEHLTKAAWSGAQGVSIEIVRSNPISGNTNSCNRRRLLELIFHERPHNSPNIFDGVG